MFTKVPPRYVAYAMFPLSLAGLAVTVYKPPFWLAMTIYGIEIAAFAFALARAVAEARRTKKEAA